jgi:hypothetical protein
MDLIFIIFDFDLEGDVFGGQTVQFLENSGIWLKIPKTLNIF